MPTPEPVVLRSSIRGILNAFLSPAVLLALATWVLLTGRPSWFTWFVGLLGAVLAVISIVDFPLRTAFGPEGVTRLCAARRHHLDWSEVVAIERAMGPRSLLPTRQGERRSFTRPGGLVARVGRRRYLLVDRVEGAAEYDALADAVKRWDDVVVVRASRPPADTPPTTLYRRTR
jgi:hypothetical protein